MRAIMTTIFLGMIGLALGPPVFANNDGSINPTYGVALGRALVAESPGFGTARPGLRAMATSTGGKTWMFGEDRSGLQNSLLLVARLDSASGLLDPAFGGGDGQLTADYPVGFHGPLLDGAVIQPDGKPLIFGYAFRLFDPEYETVGLVCRLNVAGNFDATFGLGGCRQLQFLASHHESCTVRDLAIDPEDNGMVVVGECKGEEVGSTNPVFVARLLANGGFDPEFVNGGVGFPAVATGKLVSINALSMQASGRFVAAATIAGIDGNHDIGILQFSNDGSLDPEWRSAGALRVAIDLADDLYDFGMGIAQRADGRILVAGIADGPGEDDEVVLVQVEADGDFDATFGDAGIAFGPTPLTAGAQFPDDIVPLRFLHTLALDDLGRAVVLTMLPFAADLRVYRFGVHGERDKNFGIAQSGYVDIDHTPVLIGPFAAEDWPKALIVERDRIVVGSRSERSIGIPTFVAVTLQASTLFADGFETP